MSSTHGKCSLYLCPQQADFSITDTPDLVPELQKIGLLAQQINPHDNNHYFTGDRFLDYIAYMGCSPAIQFEASKNNEDYCFIRLHSYRSAKLINSLVQTRAPHCPVCRKTVKDWQHTKTSSAISCTHCHTTSRIEAFNWRKMAGFARLFIEITDVFPKEAIPQQLLMDKLSSISKTHWLYFYSCQ